MFQDNRKKVNASLAKCFAGCTVVLFALMLSTWVGIFNFSSELKVMILCVGLFATLGPICLLKAGVSDVFLQYYMHISMGAFIGLMGTNNGIGVYITYVLVPLASALYFDKKFTLRVGIFSYLMMTIGVYFNTAGKLEITYMHWSHWVCFRNYMLGFTLEYVVIMLFIYQIVKRASEFLTQQQESIGVLQTEYSRQKEMSAYVSNSMNSQRKTVLQMVQNEMQYFSQVDYTRLAAGHQFIAQLQDTLRYAASYHEAMKSAMALCGEYFQLTHIFYVEPDFDNKKNKLSFQWSKPGEEEINDFFDSMSEEEAQKIKDTYDAQGYILVSPQSGGYRDGIENIGLTKYMETMLSGSQLWIPTLTEGEYDGAVCFDKRDASTFSAVDIFLLSEVVSMLSMHVMRMNAENSNRAKSAFLSSMSHEIRTPMNAILGMTTVALREDMSDSVRKSLNIIRSSSEGLLAIINDILDFSKIESGRVDIIPEEYHTLSLLNDLTTIVEARNAEKGLKIIYEFSEKMPAVLRGDMVRVKQVMVNLANNAVKYTDEGSVTIRVSCNRIKASKVNLHFEVQDTGQGIREEDMEKLFMSFTQLNQEKNHHKEGTGLGLAISKQLVEMMDGTIGVKSKFGEGSTFYFDIPQRVVDETPAGRLEDFEYETSSSNVNISFTAPEANVLIVDDNEINLMVAAALFAPFGMLIDTATSGSVALNMVQNKVYDLIFMDHYMPDMDGEEVTEHIRNLKENANCRVPIVALTADAVSGVKEKLLQSGMDDFLSKPIDLKLAKKILKKYLPKQKVIYEKVQ